MIKTTPSIIFKENIINNDPVIVANQYIPTVAFIPSSKGPSLINTTIYTPEEFIDKFGLPDDYNYKFWYSIYEYLRYFNGINIMRVIDDTWKNNSIRYTSTTTKYTDSVSDMYNYDIAFNILNKTSSDFFGSDTTTKFEIINREVSNEEDVAVSICNSSNYETAISNEEIGDYCISFQTTDPDIDDFPKKVFDTTVQYIINTSAKTKHYYSSTKIVEAPIQEIYTSTNTIIKILKSDVDEDISNTIEIYLFDCIEPSKNGVYGCSTPTDGGDYWIITLTSDISVYGSTKTSSKIGKIWINPTTPYTTADMVKSEALVNLRYYYDGVTKTLYQYTSAAGGRLTKINLDYDIISFGNKIYKKTMDLYTQNPYTGVSKSYKDIINKKIDWNVTDHIIFVFKKKDELFTLMEYYEISLTDPATANESKKKIYCEKIINNGSRYIYIKNNLNNTNTSTILSNNSLSLTDCVISNDTEYGLTQLLDYDTYEEATNWYRYYNNIKFSYIMGIELEDSNTGNKNLNLASDIAKYREDVIAINTLWDEKRYINYLGQELTTAIIDDLGTFGDNIGYSDNFSTYLITYINMKNIYDEYNETYRWIPLVGDICGMFSAIDLTNPFSAPAGTSSISVRNVIRMLYNDNTTTYLDQFAYNNINPIIYDDASNGYYLYDILMTDSNELATNRLNIRRTVNYIKRDTSTALKKYFFLTNTPELRTNVITDIRNILNYAASLNGIYSEFYVICDDSNNSEEDENLNISILIRPIKAIRNILIEINLYKNIININETEI